MKKFLSILSQNMIFGIMMAMFLGVGPLAGAAFGFSVGFFPQNAKNALKATVYKEVWTGELIKAFRAADQATFLDGVMDMSQYVENDVVHLVDIGVDPEVLINNTTYPISITELEDDDIALSLDKYQTEATSITDDELYALSYDKIASVKERHAQAIIDKKFGKALHAIAPATTGVKTPIVKTTGEVDTDMGRKRITKTDIIALKKYFDDLKVPSKGRRLVLCTDHINDLLLLDQKFADQYFNYTTGKISNLYGFEVYEYVDSPYYNGSTSAKKAFGSVPVDGTDFRASVAFSVKRVVKMMGSTKMYFSPAEQDTQYQRNLVNFRHYFMTLPVKQEAIGAIISDISGNI